MVDKKQQSIHNPTNHNPVFLAEAPDKIMLKENQDVIVDPELFEVERRIRIAGQGGKIKIPQFDRLNPNVEMKVLSVETFPPTVELKIGKLTIQFQTSVLNAVQALEEDAPDARNLFIQKETPADMPSFFDVTKQKFIPLEGFEEVKAESQSNYATDELVYADNPATEELIKNRFAANANNIVDINEIFTVNGVLQLPKDARIVMPELEGDHLYVFNYNLNANTEYHLVDAGNNRIAVDISNDKLTADEVIKTGIRLYHDPNTENGFILSLHGTENIFFTTADAKEIVLSVNGSVRKTPLFSRSEDIFGNVSYFDHSVGMNVNDPNYRLTVQEKLSTKLTSSRK